MKTHKLMILSLTLFVLLAYTSGCGKDDDGNNGTHSYDHFTDPRDGETYKSIKIGDQVWMAENLRYLPLLVEPDSASHTIPLYYVLAYQGDSVAEAKATDYYKTYGALYNWTAARSACPAGWHLPTLAEWMQLANYVGGATTGGEKLKESGTEHWGVINDKITDEFGFTALPGGCCINNGLFDGLGNFGTWWTDTEIDSTGASYILMTDNAGVYSGRSIKEHGFSIRCVKN